MTDPLLFAWTLFINFNWPARLDVRGMPDPNKQFGGPGPVVWQTWKTSQNLYVKPGETPLPWNQGSIYQPPALQSSMIDGKVLTDNNGNPVMYEVRENEDTLNYIIERNLYTQAGQLKLLRGGLPVSFPYTAMEIKASWRFLGKGDDPTHYLTATVRYQDKERVVGLNGLHITSKILPQWFWCTFEQIEADRGCQRSEFGKPHCGFQIQLPGQLANRNLFPGQLFLLDLPFDGFHRPGREAL